MTFAYDAANVSNSKGHLTSVANANSTTSYTAFDALGSVTGSSQATGGQTYNFSYAYNLTEALTSETYPSGRVVATSYDGANRVVDVSGTYTGNVTKYVQNVSYWPAGAPYYFTHGNNVVPVWTCNSRLQLSLLYATVGEGVDEGDRFRLYAGVQLRCLREHVGDEQ